MDVKHRRLLALGLTVAFVAVVGGAHYALAAKADDTGFTATAKTAGLSNAQPISQIVGQLVNAVISLVGTILVVLIIYAGFLWMTAQGAEEKVKKAKAILTNAVIGMIIIFAAYSISDFIFRNAYTAATVERSAGVNTGLQGCLDVCNVAADADKETCKTNCNGRNFAAEDAANQAAADQAAAAAANQQ